MKYRPLPAPAPSPKAHAQGWLPVIAATSLHVRKSASVGAVPLVVLVLVCIQTPEGVSPDLHGLISVLGGDGFGAADLPRHGQRETDGGCVAACEERPQRGGVPDVVEALESLNAREAIAQRDGIGDGCIHIAEPRHQTRPALVFRPLGRVFPSLGCARPESALGRQLFREPLLGCFLRCRGVVASRAEMRDPARFAGDCLAFRFHPAGAPIGMPADEREPVTLGQCGDILALGEQDRPLGGEGNDVGRVRFFVRAPSGVLVALFGKCFGFRKRARRPFYGAGRFAAVFSPAFHRHFAQRLGFGFGRGREVTPGA